MCCRNVKKCQICRFDVFFQAPNTPKLVSAEAPPRTAGPCLGAYDAPQAPYNWLGSGTPSVVTDRPPSQIPGYAYFLLSHIAIRPHLCRYILPTRCCANN